MTDPLVRGVRESARVSGMPRDYLYRAIHDGRLGVIRLGRRVLVPVVELERFVARETEGGVAMAMPPSDQDEDGATD